MVRGMQAPNIPSLSWLQIQASSTSELHSTTKSSIGRMCSVFSRIVPRMRRCHARSGAGAYFSFLSGLQLSSAFVPAVLDFEALATAIEAILSISFVS